MGFIALLYGLASMVIFFTGVLLSAIGMICLIVYLIKRRKYRSQKKVKPGFLIAAIAFFVFGLPPTIAVPAFISYAGNLSIDRRVSPKDHPVINAIAKHDHSKLESLLKNGADPNEAYQHIPALFWACSNDGEGVDLDDVKILIKYNADMDAKTDKGIALIPYILTGEIGDRDQTETYRIIDYLINNGYDVNETDCEGVTLLMFATAGSSASPSDVLSNRIIQLLISKGIDVNATDNLGRTALMWECGYSNDSSIEPNIPHKQGLCFPYILSSASAVEILIGAGANVDAKDKNGYRALDYFKSVEEFTQGWADSQKGLAPDSIQDYVKTCQTIEGLLRASGNSQ